MGVDDFFSILADGSTDISNTEQEIIYVTMLNENNKPVTQYVTLSSVPKANAENITEALKETMTKKLKLKNWQNNIVGCCFDGAAVMLRPISGVGARLAKEAKHIMAIHCCAHRLELAVKNVDIPEMKKLDDVLQDLYVFYKGSRNAWDDLQKVWTVVLKKEEKIKRPVQLIGVR